MMAFWHALIRDVGIERAIGLRWTLARCHSCGWPQLRRVYTNWPRLEPGERPIEEHRAAQTPVDWRDGEQSDHLATRKA